MQRARNFQMVPNNDQKFERGYGAFDEEQNCASQPQDEIWNLEIYPRTTKFLFRNHPLPIQKHRKALKHYNPKRMKNIQLNVL